MRGEHLKKIAEGQSEILEKELKRPNIEAANKNLRNMDEKY